MMAGRCSMRGKSGILLLICGCLPAQTTQGVITGRVFDRTTDKPILAATITYQNIGNGESGSVPVNIMGVFTVLSLSPGTYRLRADAPGHQAQEFYELELPVSARMQL